MKISEKTDKIIAKGALVFGGLAVAGFVAVSLNHGAKHGEPSDDLKNVAPSERAAAAQENNARILQRQAQP